MKDRLNDLFTLAVSIVLLALICGTVVILEEILKSL